MHINIHNIWYFEMAPTEPLSVIPFFTSDVLVSKETVNILSEVGVACRQILRISLIVYIDEHWFQDWRTLQATPPLLCQRAAWGRRAAGWSVVRRQSAQDARAAQSSSSEKNQMVAFPAGKILDAAQTQHFHAKQAMAVVDVWRKILLMRPVHLMPTPSMLTTSMTCRATTEPWT